MMEKEALRVENACGRFLKLAVLDHFNFSANSGEICFLFGAHNAGKTAFMQLLAGKMTGEWSMRLLIDGVDVHWSPGKNPAASLFAFIWDESRLLPNFSVAENLCIFGQVPLWKLYIRKSSYESQTRRMLRLYDLGGIDARRKVGQLSKAQCILLEIVRYAMHGARFFFLDCLSLFQHSADIAGLERLLKKLASEGKTVVLLSNRADRRLFFADRFVIMRSGARVKTISREAVTVDLLKAYGELAQYPSETEELSGSQAQGTAVLTAKKWMVLDRECSFEACRGRLTGIVCPDERYAICLMQGFDSGKFTAASFRFMDGEYAGRTMRWRALRRICAVKSLLAEKTIIPNFSALDNIYISSAWVGNRFPRLRKSVRKLVAQEEKELLCMVEQAMEEHREEPLLNLRILAKRAILMQCQLIVLDRPSRGLDENGCKELQEILRELANHGMAVIILDTRKRNLQDLCSEVAEFQPERLPE